MQPPLALSGTVYTLINWQSVTAKSTYFLNSEWLAKLPPDQQYQTQRAQCAVAISKFEYATSGGSGEPTNATGVLMVPSGTAAVCHGPRPILLYAHGTAIDRTFDLAAIDSPSNPAHRTAQRLALIFAAQGYIVVAPNYAGYDRSRLKYAPYLNQDQQSRDMLDALAAARQLLGLEGEPSTDGGQLLVAGYSQGGHVAVATLRRLENQHRPATAGAGLSGPYGLAAEADEIFLGHASLGGTVYLSMVANSYAHMRHGHILPSTIFSPQYPDSPSLFPGVLPQGGYAALVAQNHIPLTALFRTPPNSSTPNNQSSVLDSIEFDPVNYLVRSSFRRAYLKDLQANPDHAAPLDRSAPDFARELPWPAEHPLIPMRQDLKRNDLREYVPGKPLLLCGAMKDPEVFWDQNTGAYASLLAHESKSFRLLNFGVLNLDPKDGHPLWFQIGLNTMLDARMEQLGKILSRDFIAHQYHNPLASIVILANLEGYHDALAPYCLLAARSFFQEFISEGVPVTGQK